MTALQQTDAAVNLTLLDLPPPPPAPIGRRSYSRVLDLHRVLPLWNFEAINRAPEAIAEAEGLEASVINTTKILRLLVKAWEREGERGLAGSLMFCQTRLDGLYESIIAEFQMLAAQTSALVKETKYV